MVVQNLTMEAIEMMMVVDYERDGGGRCLQWVGLIYGLGLVVR